VTIGVQQACMHGTSEVCTMAPVLTCPAAHEAPQDELHLQLQVCNLVKRRGMARLSLLAQSRWPSCCSRVSCLTWARCTCAPLEPFKLRTRIGLLRVRSDMCCITHSFVSDAGCVANAVTGGLIRNYVTIITAALPGRVYRPPVHKLRLQSSTYSTATATLSCKAGEYTGSLTAYVVAMREQASRRLRTWLVHAARMRELAAAPRGWVTSHRDRNVHRSQERYAPVWTAAHDVWCTGQLGELVLAWSTDIVTPRGPEVPAADSERGRVPQQSSRCFCTLNDCRTS
jgi:hypothetical protein